MTWGKTNRVIQSPYLKNLGEMREIVMIGKLLNNMQRLILMED